MTNLPVVRLHLLGAFRVFVGERPVPGNSWRSLRAAGLVKLLALAPGYRLHREQVMETFWPDLSAEAQANNLHVSVSRARHALEAAGAPPGTLIVREGPLLVLGPPECIWTDVEAFEAAASAARHREDPETLSRALACYGGDLLADDPYESWIEPRRNLLRSTFRDLLQRLGRAHAAAGDSGPAIEAYQHLVAMDATDEQTVAALMALYARSGQRALALLHYDKLTTALRSELDTVPDQATRDLAAAIRDGRYPEWVRPAQASAPERQRRLQRPFNTLPQFDDELIGRETDVASITQLLAIRRLVTLTGAGGIGKTRLAIAAAQAARDRFTDGIVFVNLAPIRDPQLVAPAIARALEIREQSNQSPQERVTRFLSDKHLLLVLDNVEQVIESAHFFQALLHQAPHLSMLVTSRVRLHLRGERECAVQPLATPPVHVDLSVHALARIPSVSLFVQRAQEILPEFRLTPGNAPVIAELCRRLEGLPLAIELAASRINVLTPEAMLSRINRPLALLVSNRRDLPERQHTMRNTIEWSYGLLSPPEQRLFRRLAIFTGGWTLEAAEAVLEPDSDLGITVLDGLSSLIDKSLVLKRDFQHGIRFGLLEPVREFARERLAETGEHERIAARCAAYFLALAEEARSHLESASQAAWLRHLDGEEDNLRQALAHAAHHHDAELGLRLVNALLMYWFIRGRIREGCDQVAKIAALPGSRDFPELLADALNGAGLLARDGNHDVADRVCSEALAISRTIGDRKREADALANLGFLSLQRGNLREAQEQFTGALAIYRALGAQQGMADATSFLALTAYYQQEFAEAQRLHEASLAIWIAVNDLQGIVWARTRLASALLRQGDRSRALHELLASLAIVESLDFPWGYSWVFDGLAHLAASQRLFSLAALLSAKASAVRASAGLLLPATEQADVDSVNRLIDEAVGHEAREAALAAHAGYSIDQLVQAVSLANPASPGHAFPAHLE